jgi:adenylate kinase
MELMLIGLTGTPGCGKTTSSSILRARGHTLMDLNQIAEENQCIVGYDEVRASKEIDIERLNNFILNEFSDTDCIIEGHLSHLLSVDKVVILRCDPVILRKRLADKNWPQSKIKENVEAEILDVIKVEAYEENHKIFEIDSSKKTPNEVADDIERIINGNYESPNIDWLKKYEYLLFESS